jgi:hypothetical protein
MKTKTLATLVLPIAMSFAAPAFADEKVQWSHLPAAVQKTITENAGGGEIEEIEKESEMILGKRILIYEADVKKTDGSKLEIRVREDGKLISMKEIIY